MFFSTKFFYHYSSRKLFNKKLNFVVVIFQGALLKKLTTKIRKSNLLKSNSYIFLQFVVWICSNFCLWRQLMSIADKRIISLFFLLISVNFQDASKVIFTPWIFFFFLNAHSTIVIRLFSDFGGSEISLSLKFPSLSLLCFR